MQADSIRASIHLTRWGRSGPTVVLVHGGAQGSRVGGDRHFAAQQALADRGWQLIAPDRPGHGRSPSPGRPDDAEADGEWVAELLGDGAHLVGHSFGGCVALAAAARRPEAVHSLTLIEPGMQKMAMRDPSVRRFGLQMMKVMLFSGSAEARARRFAQLLHIPPEIRGGSDAAELERMGRAITRLKLPSKRVLERELRVVQRARLPLLVVTGGWSPAFEATADTVAALGGGERKVIRSEHHFPQLVSDEFDQVLDAFMRLSDALRGGDRHAIC